MLTLFRDTAVYQKYKREETGMKLQKRQPRTAALEQFIVLLSKRIYG